MQNFKQNEIMSRERERVCSNIQTQSVLLSPLAFAGNMSIIEISQTFIVHSLNKIIKVLFINQVCFVWESKKVSGRSYCEDREKEC